MNWSIALEEQAATKQVLQQLVSGRVDAAEYFAESRPPVRTVLRKSLDAACDGEAMFIERDIVHALWDVSNTVPDDWTLTPDVLVSCPTFCWFEDPAAHVRLLDGTELPVNGYAWAMVQDSDDTPGLNVMPLTRARDFVYPLSWFGWAWGSRLDERLEWLQLNRSSTFAELDESAKVPIGYNGTGIPISDNWGVELRLFAALVEFTRQTIVQRVRREPTRAAKRRLRLPPEHIPTIAVVTLRKRGGESQRHDDDEPTFEYSHRFIVRPHWRNQWYPSLDVHRPRLVASYVKGPSDKPLIVKRRVFNVAR